MIHRRSWPLCLLALLVLVGGCRAPIAPVARSVASPSPTAAPSAAPQPSARPSATPVDQRGLVVLGALKLSPSGRRAHADVAGYKNLAFVGKWSGACPATGVDIIDISDPRAPVRLSSTPPRPGMSMEDIQAIAIGDRDVLAIGLQACRGSGQAGLDLVDISDPRQPQSIGLFATEVGVHEFGLTRTPDGRTLALLALPGLEARTADAGQRGGDGDLLIVDVSDPRAPTLLAEWGVLDEPALGPEFALLAQRGSFPSTFLHSVRANADGTRAYLSYWDAGVIILDISDPAQPRYLGHTPGAPDQEGNAHSIAVTPDDTLLVEADEDFTPRDQVLSSSALEGDRSVTRIPYTAPTAKLAGALVYVGRGCPAESRAEEPTADAYLADPRGKIALIEGGACRADRQIARAQQAGATGAIIFGGSFGLGDAALYQGEGQVRLPDGTLVTLTIPAVIAPLSVGRALATAAGPVTVEVEERFGGWGGLRLYDIRDPARPVELSSFVTGHANDPDAPASGMWSVHNPDLHGTILYASWYRDGIRAIDLTKPTAPHEVAAWVGAGRPDDAPPVNIWGVVVHGDLLLASDFNYGLYILTYRP